MDNSPEHKAAEGDVDHGFGDIEPLFVISYETFPAGHPAERALDHPSPREHLEAGLFVSAADDFKDEVTIGGSVHEAGTVICAVGEWMFEPGPALADSRDYGLGTGAVRDVGGGQIDHQQPAIGVYGDVTLATDNLLSSIVATLFSRWRLDGLTVDHRCEIHPFSNGL